MRSLIMIMMVGLVKADDNLRLPRERVPGQGQALEFDPCRMSPSASDSDDCRPSRSNASRLDARLYWTRFSRRASRLSTASIGGRRTSTRVPGILRRTSSRRRGEPRAPRAGTPSWRTSPARASRRPARPATSSAPGPSTCPRISPGPAGGRADIKRVATFPRRAR